MDRVLTKAGGTAAGMLAGAAALGGGAFVLARLVTGDPEGGAAGALTSAMVGFLTYLGAFLGTLFGGPGGYALGQRWLGEEPGTGPATVAGAVAITTLAALAVLLLGVDLHPASLGLVPASGVLAALVSARAERRR